MIPYPHKTVKLEWMIIICSKLNDLLPYDNTTEVKFTQQKLRDNLQQNISISMNCL